MNVGVTSAVLASVVSLTVAISVVFRRPYLPLYTRFACLGGALFLWHTGSLVTRLTGGPMSSFQACAGVLIPPAIIVFFGELLRDRTGRVRRATQASMAMTALLLLFNASPIGNLTVLRVVLVTYVIGAAIWVLQLLRIHIAKAGSETERKRLRYLLVGGGVTLVLGTGELIQSSAVPAALGHVTATCYIYFLYQSIIARRLMNLVELLGKAAVLGVLSLVLATIYSLLVLWVGHQQQGLWLFNTVVASFVILILYDQLRTWVENTTAKFIFRHQYALRKITQDLIHTLRTTISIERMCDQTLDALYDSGVASQAAIFLRNPATGVFRLIGQRGHGAGTTPALDHYPTLLHEIRREQRPILLEDLTYRYDDLPQLITLSDASFQRELERTEESINGMHAIGATVLLPLCTEERLVGVLSLGSGQTPQGYSTDNLASLLSLAEACAIVVENSQEYEKHRERDRLVTIGAMATGMAHEIRNPLGAIKGAAQCLEPAQMPEKTVELLDVIVEEVDRLNIVVTQFLDYARPYHGNPVPTDINAIIGATFRLLEHDSIPEHITVRQDLAHELPEVVLDPEHLKQILLNLIRNAIEAMSSQGDLTLRTSVSHDDPTSRAAAGEKRLEHARVLIQVSDTGPGISGNDLRQLFVPFYTTKSHGTGLGLPISQRLAEQCGGRIEVTSALGKGTTFTIRLPARTNG